MGENSVTSLWRNSCLINMRLTYKDKASIKLDRQQKNINPVDYAVWGALQQDVLQSSDRGFGGSQRQSAYLLGLISTNNWSSKQLIPPWRQTLKTVVKVHGGHIEQLFTWRHVLLYEDFAVLLIVWCGMSEKCLKLQVFAKIDFIAFLASLGVK